MPTPAGRDTYMIIERSGAIPRTRMLYVSPAKVSMR